MPFSLISNGIDLEKFQYDPVVRERLRNEYDLEDKLVIGHVGRFCEEKNHKKILEIAKELQKRHQKIKLVFVGAVSYTHLDFQNKRRTRFNNQLRDRTEQRNIFQSRGWR